jgi:2-(1,2-epoxy-1,2-dihydrophenyl)acetyl-CoA isomerase
MSDPGSQDGAAKRLVEVEVSGARATIRLNRPDVLNTMTADLLTELLEAVESLAADTSVRVVVLTGAGRAFCAGGDLRAGVGGAVAGPPPLAAQERRLRTFMRVVQLLHDSPAIVLAAINGACAGAGLSLALAADLRICSPWARFSTAFLAAGLSGDFGGTWLLTRVVGAGLARELYLRSAIVDAERALAVGLVSEVCDDVLGRAHELAAELLGRAPLALRAVKQNLNDAETETFATLLDREAARHTACVATDDAAEATAAFLERRQPRFTGR